MVGIPSNRSIARASLVDLRSPEKRTNYDDVTGPAGNGKTISIKALMNSLFRSDGLSIPSLYVKSATSTYSIRSIFQQARYMSPCLLIFEDIDTVVTNATRSYFFNEVDVRSHLFLLYPYIHQKGINNFCTGSRKQRRHLHGRIN